MGTALQRTTISIRYGDGWHGGVSDLSPDLVEPGFAERNLSSDHGGGKDAKLGHLSHAQVAAGCPGKRKRERGSH